MQTPRPSVDVARVQRTYVPAELGRRRLRAHLGDMDTMPTLFLSHGSPMLAVQDSAAGRFLDGLGAQLPKPRAIVVASAHFAAVPTHVGTAALPRTVHDFGGFPPALYDLQYPAAGLPVLGEEIARHVSEAGIPVRVATEHGLDHGVWVPLRRMYPEADIPVVPLSVDPRGDAAAHLALGRALADLRRDDILVIGSGGFVHNLGDLDWQHPDAPLAPWAAEFADWMRGRLRDHDIDALADWQARAPHARHAHPTVEHLMPLFVALGAAGDAPTMRHLHQSHEFGTLALDAFAFD
jgi:4,5-DOPA dioxygenase extradiol